MVPSPQSTMNVEGHVLPSTSRLRCICITEIVFGALTVFGGCYGLTKQKPANHNGWSIFHIVCAALLLGTGIHGVHAIGRFRMRILDSRSFRILGACNMVLGVIYAISFLVLLSAVIFLATLPNVAHTLLGYIAFANDDDQDDEDSVKEMRRKYSDISWRSNRITVGYVIMGLAGILTGLTVSAATISSRLSSSVAAASPQVIIPPAGVPLIVPSGYGAHSMATIDPPPSYSPYPDPPFKSDLN